MKTTFFRCVADEPSRPNTSCVPASRVTASDRARWVAEIRECSMVRFSCVIGLIQITSTDYQVFTHRVGPRLSSQGFFAAIPKNRDLWLFGAWFGNNPFERKIDRCLKKDEHWCLWTKTVKNFVERHPALHSIPLLKYTFLLNRLEAIHVPELKIAFIPNPKAANRSIKLAVATSLNPSFTGDPHKANWIYVPTNRLSSIDAFKFGFVRNPLCRTWRRSRRRRRDSPGAAPRRESRGRRA